MTDAVLRPLDIPVLVIRCVLALYYTAYLSLLEIWRFAFPTEGKSLKDKHALVTGAGGALGRELCLSLAREGCRVTAVDVDMPACQETARQVAEVSPRGAEYVQCHRLDVTDNRAVTTLADTVGPVDILVNNAGIVQAGSLLSVTDQQIRNIIDVNLMAHFWTVRAFLPAMLTRGTGHVVAISSAAALTAASNIAPYCSSKAGVSGLMGCLREELRQMRSDIKTTTVQPFFLSPPQHKKHWEVKSVLPDITAASVAQETVRAVRRDMVTLTLPPYLFFTMYLVRLVPAKASDLWRDIFAARIDALQTTTSLRQQKE